MSWPKWWPLMRRSTYHRMLDEKVLAAGRHNAMVIREAEQDRAELNKLKALLQQYQHTVREVESIADDPAVAEVKQIQSEQEAGPKRFGPGALDA